MQDPRPISRAGPENMHSKICLGKGVLLHGEVCEPAQQSMNASTGQQEH